nr:PAS domain S-box protein [Planctomycetota bacterium]
MNEVVAERTLPANELQALSKIIEQATEGVVIIDLDGIVRFVNTAWGQMHGYGNTADLLGEHIETFHTKEQMRNELVSLLEEAKRRGRIAGPIDHLKRDGTTFLTQTKVLLLNSPSNEPSGFIILAADCTDGRKSKARLKQLSAELDQLRGTNEQLGKQVAQLKAANEQLRDQTAEQEGLTGRLNDCREHANDLERRATELEAQNRQYEEQAAEHRKLASELNDLEQQIAELTQGKERLQQQACNHNETEERLRQEVAELEQR